MEYREKKPIDREIVKSHIQNLSTPIASSDKDDAENCGKEVFFKDVTKIAA